MPSVAFRRTVVALRRVGDCAQLVQDGFTTTRASGAFDASYTEFTTGATKTVQGIEGMASFLEKAAQALQSTDEQLASQLGQ